MLEEEIVKKISKTGGKDKNQPKLKTEKDEEEEEFQIEFDKTP